jgi:N-acyl-D-amino-acid deacylase
VIREGAHADLVLFDPLRIRDRATFTEPTLPAEGIEEVWVNGVPVFAAHAATGEKPGRLITRNRGERPATP